MGEKDIPFGIKRSGEVFVGKWTTIDRLSACTVALRKVLSMRAIWEVV